MPKFREEEGEDTDMKKRKKYAATRAKKAESKAVKQSAAAAEGAARIPVKALQRAVSRKNHPWMVQVREIVNDSVSSLIQVCGGIIRSFLRLLLLIPDFLDTLLILFFDISLAQEGLIGSVERTISSGEQPQEPQSGKEGMV